MTSYLSRLLSPTLAHRNPTPSWPIMFTLGWCGMRGIISLAAALSLPFTIAPGLAFQHRDLILFITFCVVLITLILPSITLPFILKFFKLTDQENKVKQEALARMRSLEGILEKLHKTMRKEQISEEIFHEFRKQIDRRMNIIKTQLNENAHSTLNREYQAIKRLTLTAIDSERQTLLQLRKAGDINDEVFHVLLEELDIEEIRAKTLRI